MNAMQRSLVFLSLAGLAAFASPAAAPVAYPDSYRTWTHVKSAVIGPGNPSHARFGGIHHIYANGLALEGLQSGNYADGATFVFDLLETRVANDVTTEGPRRHVDVMVKNIALYAATGGWGFEEFKGDSRVERVVGADAATQCYACHVTRAAKGYVFSELRP